MKFIKLTLTNGKVIFVNIALALDVFTSANHTTISFGDDYFLNVKELPNEIFNLAEHNVINS